MDNENISSGLGTPSSIDAEPGNYASEKLEPGQLLWHYTRDFNGLRGVVGGEIWGSSLPYLNDTQEFRYGIELAMDALEELFEDNQQMKELHKLLWIILINRYEPSDIFSISFSTEDDDLSQWRGYSGTGPSFSIGFDPRKLECAANDYLFKLHEVKYERAEIIADVRQKLQEHIDTLNEMTRGLGATQHPSDFARSAAVDLAARLLQLAPKYKHPKFAAEKEWRLVRRTHTFSRGPQLDRQFRLSGSLVVPYVAMPLHTALQEGAVSDGQGRVDSPIASIIIGPSPHARQLKYVIADMIARSRLNNVSVESSAVPFRNW
jgi:hypothetical protein